MVVRSLRGHLTIRPLSPHRVVPNTCAMNSGYPPTAGLRVRGLQGRTPGLAGRDACGNKAGGSVFPVAEHPLGVAVFPETCPPGRATVREGSRGLFAGAQPSEGPPSGRGKGRACWQRGTCHRPVGAARGPGVCEPALARWGPAERSWLAHPEVGAETEVVRRSGDFCRGN